MVSLPSPGASGDDGAPLVAGLLRDLQSAGRADTAEGEHALFLARRLVAQNSDTGSAVASLSKELRAARADALRGAQPARSGLDELRARRDAKRGA